jgi:putative glutamine amidotransferase
VAKSQQVRVDGVLAEVNSYHHYGALDSREPLRVWAVADDGVVKAIRHASSPVTGIMWHPERIAPFSSRDIALFRAAFRVS